MSVSFKKYDVVRVPSGNATFLLLDNDLSGKALCLNDNTFRLLSELSGESSIEVIGQLSMFDIKKSTAPVLLSMTDLMVLLDCAMGSLNSDESDFHYDESTREDVKDKITERLEVIKLKVSDA